MTASIRRIGILGTGPVGQSLAVKLTDLGHAVFVGTRNPSATLARSEPDSFGNPPFEIWHAEHPEIGFGTFSKAAAHGELVINATSGTGSIEALSSAGKQNLAGKVLLDVANPLDFSRGMPPSLTVCNTDSLGEQIQRTFPEASVVKALNTVNAYLMVEPLRLAQAEHTIFVSGNDTQAKKTVRKLLQSFGWKDIVDLGDISTARGPWHCEEPHGSKNLHSRRTAWYFH